jgi:multiple sugar transport system ATP-binding protein
VEENGKYYVTPFGAKIEVDGENGELLRQKKVGSREILLGVRPEHINLASSADNAISGNILVNEMMGSELHLHVQVGGTDKLIVRTPTVNLTHEERHALRENHAVYLTFPGKVMYFFDPETEKSLL